MIESTAKQDDDFIIGHRVGRGMWECETDSRRQICVRSHIFRWGQDTPTELVYSLFSLIISLGRLLAKIIWEFEVAFIAKGLTADTHYRVRSSTIPVMLIRGTK